MIPSIWYSALMYGEKYSECILIYSYLDIGFYKEQSFRSQDINLAPWRASEILIMNSSFYSKGGASGDNASSGYSSLSPPTANMTLYGSDFSGR